MSLAFGKSASMNALGLTVARVAGAGLGMLAQLLMAFYLGASDLGTFYLITSAIMVLGMAATLGYGGLSNQLIVRYVTREDRRSLRRFKAQAWLETGIVSSILACLLAAVTIQTGRLDDWVAIAGIMVGVPAFAMLRLHGGMANAVKRFYLAFLPDNLLRPFALVIVLVMLHGFVGSLTLPMLVLVFGLLAAIAAIAQGVQLFRITSQFSQLDSQTRSSLAGGRQRQSRAWRGSGIRLIGPLMIAGLAGDITILLAGLVLSAEELGVFGLMLKISVLIGFAVHALHQLATPILAEGLLARNQDKVSKQVTTINIILISATSFGLLFVTILGQYGLKFLGGHFEQGYTILVLLTAVALVRSLGGPAMPLLMAAGKHRKALKVNLAMPVVLAVAMGLMGWTAGSIGAACAVLFVNIGLTVALARICLSETGIRCHCWAIWRQKSSVNTSAMTSKAVTS
jgi:O-antigen/teichoic acid export membrane protein